MSNIYLPRSQRKALSSVGHTLTPPSRGCHCSPTKKSCYHPGGLTHAYPESEKQLGLRWVANAATSFLPTSHPSLVTWSCDTAAALGSCSADPALPQQPGVPQSLPLAPLVPLAPLPQQGLLAAHSQELYTCSSCPAMLLSFTHSSHLSSSTMPLKQHSD